MTTRITNNGIMVLSPAEGMRLTDGETVAEGAVYLGKNDTVDNWREITAEEKAAWDAEQKAKSDAEAFLDTL